MVIPEDGCRSGSDERDVEEVLGECIELVEGEVRVVFTLWVIRETGTDDGVVKYWIWVGRIL